MLLKMMIFLFCLLTIISIRAQDTTQKIIPGRFNSLAQQKKPYVILISADGFRYDMAEKYNAENLLRLRKEGITSSFMQPSYPSVTFPNHYSIITGLYPAHHGLVDNFFFDEKKNERYTMSDKKIVSDGSWYGGSPLWVLAEKQQMLSASFYWVASEADIQGTRPSYYYDYNDIIPIDRRIDVVKKWLQLPEDKRPHFITFYFPQVDHEAHKYGPGSVETKNAVLFVDSAIGKLVAGINELHLPVNFIFVSDHGMTTVDTTKAIPVPSIIDTSKFTICVASALVHVYAKNKKDIIPAYKALKKEAGKYSVYLPDELPAYWNYSKTDDWYNRIGDIILVPHLPGFFSLAGWENISIGKHGFDTHLPDMYASFYAWGPAFKQGIKIDGFENVNVFPLIAQILGLNYSHKIDGRLEVLKPILKQ